MVQNNYKSFLFILAILLVLKRKIRQRRIGRRPDTNSVLAGHYYVNEIIHGNPAHSKEMLRMDKEVFLKLCTYFKNKGWLQNSRYLSIEEKVAMFLMTLGQGHSTRVLKRRFNHSTHTIHKYFYEVLRAVLMFSKEIIVPHNSSGANGSTRQRRLREMFKGAVGALDGTLIDAVVPTARKTPYRGRGKGDCFQNVLAICDFNMVFIFIWAGWEGVAHDSRVLTDTLSDPSNNFPIPPPDKYYLCDAAYPHTRGFMAPYRNVRYWLSDFRGVRPRTKEEMFNQSHAHLRNVIERAFGVLKSRFPILKKMPPYPFSTQRNIVIACAAIHNYLRMTNSNDTWFQQFADEDQIVQEDERMNEDIVENDLGRGFEQSDQMFMLNLRDEIATQMTSRMRQN